MLIIFNLTHTQKNHPVSLVSQFLKKLRPDSCFLIQKSFFLIERLKEMLEDLPKACDKGVKKDSKGNTLYIMPCSKRGSMKHEINPENLRLNSNVRKQIQQCLNLIKEILRPDLLGVYLFGSSILGGLQKYSDLDLFVVSNRATTRQEKAKLATALLKISGIYMKSEKLPIEMTIVEKSEINPWHYPPKIDFQYGEWLRKQFEHGNIEQWPTKEMPDLALLITQILLASNTLVGANPDQLLCKVPYKDFMAAIRDGLPHLMLDLDSDVRNVLLTLARIWSTVATDAIRTKPAAADWAINHLPEKYRPVMERAKAICMGQEKEHWDDIQELIKPCADFMFSKANNKITEIMLSHDMNRSIKIAESINPKTSVFRFAPAISSQKNLIHNWLEQPHLKEWIHGIGLQNTLKGLEKFFAKDSDTIYWIGYHNGTPFSFLITSPLGTDAITLDVFICDLNYLGKGLAVQMIQEFLNSQFRHVQKVLIDPEATNTRAIHVYQKVGFKIIGEFIASWHQVPHYQMELNMEKICIK